MKERMDPANIDLCGPNDGTCSLVNSARSRKQTWRLVPNCSQPCQNRSQHVSTPTKQGAQGRELALIASVPIGSGSARSGDQAHGTASLLLGAHVASSSPQGSGRSKLKATFAVCVALVLNLVKYLQKYLELILFCHRAVARRRNPLPRLTCILTDSHSYPVARNIRRTPPLSCHGNAAIISDLKALVRKTDRCSNAVLLHRFSACRHELPQLYQSLWR